MPEERSVSDRLLNDRCFIKINEASSKRLVVPTEVGKIKFQYPPRLVSDNKTSNWKESKKSLAWEPIAFWESSQARKVTIEITYIVTGGEWSTNNIANITREFKRIHYGNLGGEGNAVSTILVMDINLFGSLIGPSGNGDTAKFRVGSTDIKYSDTIVVGRNSNLSWPLKTTITMSGWLVTRVGEKQNLINVKAQPIPEWF